MLKLNCAIELVATNLNYSENHQVKKLQSKTFFGDLLQIVKHFALKSNHQELREYW